MSLIQNGESFERLAEKFSNGGNAIIDIERGELPESMEQVVFSLGPGRISSVYESNRGFHIFKMAQYVPQHVLTLDAVKPQIIDRLRNDRFEAAYPEIIRKLRDEMIIKS
jgi:parvulin-like peptidyl-prolyl isomerase